MPLSTPLDPCPICGGIGCVTYPLMVERFATGRDVEHWRLIHDRINGKAPMTLPPGPDDRALRDYVERHGCCG